MVFFLRSNPEGLKSPEGGYYHGNHHRRTDRRFLGAGRPEGPDLHQGGGTRLLPMGGRRNLSQVGGAHERPPLAYGRQACGGNAARAGGGSREGSPPAPRAELRPAGGGESPAGEARWVREQEEALAMLPLLVNCRWCFKLVSWMAVMNHGGICGDCRKRPLWEPAGVKQIHHTRAMRLRVVLRF